MPYHVFRHLSAITAVRPKPNDVTCAYQIPLVTYTTSTMECGKPGAQAFRPRPRPRPVATGGGLSPPWKNLSPPP